MLTMTSIDNSSDPQLLSLGPESVSPSKPRVRRLSGEPWVMCRATERTLQGFHHAAMVGLQILNTPNHPD